jgi:hypothetical protein
MDTSSESAQKIGRRLEEELDRIQSGITVAANHLNKARNTVYNWCEKGNVPADQLSALAEIGVDVTYVLTGQRQAPADLTSEEATLVENYRAICPDQRASLATVGAAFAESAQLKGGANGKEEKG